MKKLFVLLLACILLVSSISFAAGTWTCPACGASCDGNFCKNDATPRPADTWTCPKCGKVNDGAFCENDAVPKTSSSAAAALTQPIASNLPAGIYSPDGLFYLGPAAKEVKLTFTKGNPVTAYAVRLLDYVDSLSDFIEDSADRVSFGSTLGKYQQFKTGVNNCYGIAVDLYINSKTPDELCFKIGTMNKRKGDYCDYHNEVSIAEDCIGTVKCYNKNAKTIDGFKTMGCQANSYSYSSTYTDVTLYFTSPSAAATFVRSMIDCLG